MWIVRLALRRPYTFVIVALLIVLLGAVSIVRTPTDIFPEVSIPVVSVIWSLTGLSVTDMEARVITTTERAFTTSVNDIEHIESQTMPGVGVIKVFFHPNAQISAAVAQVTSISQTLLRTMPPGTTPPLILQYSASSVPILQLSVGSTTLTEGQLFDYAQNFIRTQLATVQGASVTLPYGGKPRQVMVDLDPKALQGKGLSASDVVNAVTAQNLVLPSGTAKIGSREYPVLLNSSPDTIAALNDLPIKQVNGSVVYVRDVAQVHDGVAVQQNIVASDGQRSSLLSILKGQGASTLAIVQRVKAALPAIQATLPPELQLTPLFDQSIFVRAALNGVVREAAIAAVLTGLMILVFLGSWRSTLIVAVSIPLSILTSLIVLGFLGYTINIMTLGGLGLAVGILVDDATVELENVHRNLGLGTALRQAILDGAQQIATPAFVSTLSICIVFVPVVFLTGIVRFLFTPLALAVVFAMLASYFLSRTLVPTMVHYMLGSEVARYAPGTSHHARGDMFWRVHEAFNTWFERFRARYRDGLAWALDRRALVLVAFGGFFAVSLVVAVFTGQDFFPQVDAGQFRLHVRAPASTRLEATDQLFNRVEDRIRKTIPPDQIGLVLRNVGLPVGGVNLAFSDSGTIGSSDGEILVSLKAALQRAAAPVIPTVTVMTPSRAPAATDFTLPGSIQAIQDVPIFARADGYLKRRLVDIGDRVQQGQVLAEIDTPDLDQQVVQGRAALAQAQASLAQAQSALQQARATLQHNEATARVNGITLERWRELKRRELVAQQDVDNFQAASDGSRADVAAAQANIEALAASANAARANVVAFEANLRRLTDLQSFQTLRAPFTGIVTVRNVDQGALISSGSAPNAMPAFRVAQIDSLRVFVNVPQTFVTSIAPGLATETLVRELPGRIFKANVFSTAEALDPASRTLLTEIRMQNEGGALRPGMYGDVKFHVTQTNPPFLVPSTAVIIRSGPPQVAVVRPDGVVHLQPVQIGRDLGSSTEVTGGLGERDTFILAPADSLQEGARVQPVLPKEVQRPA